MMTNGKKRLLKSINDLMSCPILKFLDRKKLKATKLMIDAPKEMRTSLAREV